MELKAYGKINLSLDILGRRLDGYHNISSLMQDISLYDVIEIKKCSQSGTKYNFSHCTISNVDVYLCTNLETIPLGDDNLAVRGARAVIERLDSDGILKSSGLEEVSIFIDKRLPVAAGIAGGSGNGAVTMLGINALAGYPYSLRELMELGAAVGADIPFSLMMNAKKNEEELKELRGIEEASTAAQTEGIGDIVRPVSPIHRFVILGNPGVAVSTREVYEAMDAIEDRVCGGELFTNQMESYTLEFYPEAAEMNKAMKSMFHAEHVLMSGSGPTMVAYYNGGYEAETDYRKITERGCKSGWRFWLAETGGVD